MDSMTVAIEHRADLETISDDARDAAARSPRADEAQIDRSVKSGEGDVMAENNASAMPADEQIRLLKTQLDEALARENDLKSKLATTATRADSADALVQAHSVKVKELEAQIAAGAQAMETQAIAEQAKRADALEEELAALKSTREAEIQKEAEVRTKAIVMMGPQFRCDGQDAREIQATVIKKFAPDRGRERGEVGRVHRDPLRCALRRPRQDGALVRSCRRSPGDADRFAARGAHRREGRRRAASRPLEGRPEEVIEPSRASSSSSTPLNEGLVRGLRSQEIPP
jgi:hypothetical protein